MKVALVALGFLCISSTAHAEKYMVMNYNEQTRVVLSSTPCPDGKKSYRAVAQRIDKQFLRGCWSVNPKTKMVHVDWEGGDFSEFDIKRFYEYEEGTKNEQAPRLQSGTI
jgi:hypothetical protein